MEPPAPRPPLRRPARDLQRAAQEAAARRTGGARQQALEEDEDHCFPDAALPLPAPWQDYFDSRRSVVCPARGATFNAYCAGDSGPVVLCLHGGGYTGLTWSLVAARLRGECRVVALDLRGHGATTVTSDAAGAAGGGDDGCGAEAAVAGAAAAAAAGEAEAEAEADLSAETLAADVVAVWEALFGSEGPEPPPPTVLVGHSMGGAVAVHAAASKGIPSLQGLVVIDVVEGTALASLPYMATVLAGRPAQFPTLRHAVRWACSSGMCRNHEAARVSLPSMLRQRGAESLPGASGSGPGQDLGAGGLETVCEEGEEDGEGAAGSSSAPAAAQPLPGAAKAAPSSSAAASGSAAGGCSDGGGQWVWRTPLARSAPHWEGWYRGLSDLFLSLAVPKVLVLAGTDRLDRSLTIGQMQGRFQLVLLPAAGHAVHEDEAGPTADAVLAFLRRFRVGQPPVALPRAPAGLAPVLPVVAGPRHEGGVPLR